MSCSRAIIEAMADTSRTIAIALRSIWLHPRTTIRSVVDRGAGGTIFLAGLFGFVIAFSIVAQNANRGYSATFDLAAMVVGSLSGIGFLYGMGALLRWTGSRLGGTADGRAVRAVITYSQIPLILSEVLLAFTNLRGEGPGYAAPPSGIFFALELIGVALTIWSLPI